MFPLSNQQQKVKPLVTIAKIAGEYYVYHCQNPKAIDHKDWMYEVLKYSKDRGILLKKGLILKFGRIQYKIADLSTDEMNDWEQD